MQRMTCFELQKALFSFSFLLKASRIACCCCTMSLTISLVIDIHIECEFIHQYLIIAHIPLSIHQKIFVKHLVCTQHHAKCCGEHRRNGRHSLCPLCSYLEVAASQGGGMTAVSTPYPVSGLGSLCYVSVAPQTFTPSQPHPALGIYDATVGGRKEGRRDR